MVRSHAKIVAMTDFHAAGDHTRRIADALRGRIVRGEIADGARLVEADIAAEFGVSRTPARVALDLLEREGFVEHRRNRGAVVKSTHHPREIADAREVQGAFAVLFVKLVVAHATDEELRDGKARLAELSDEDPAAAEEILADVQQRLIAATRNRVFQQAMARFEIRQRVLAAAIEPRTDARRWLHALMDALVARDVEAAVSLLEEEESRIQRVGVDRALRGLEEAESAASGVDGGGRG